MGAGGRVCEDLTGFTFGEGGDGGRHGYFYEGGWSLADE